MRILHATLLFVGATLSVPVAADEASERAIEKDRKLIAGDWLIAKLVVNGNESKAEDIGKLMVTNEPNGKWILKSDGQVVAQGTSTIDPSATPKTINFTTVGGDQDGKRYQGIYQLGRQQRKMCFAPSDKDRPKSFSSAEGSDNILVVFQAMPKKVEIGAPLPD